MCTSMVQVVYVGILIAATAMTLGSFFAPSWRNYSFTNVTSGDAMDDLKTGLLARVGCDGEATNITTLCKDSFSKKEGYEKVVIVAFVLALLAEALCFVWSCVICFACCCKSCLTPPLALLSVAATLLLALGVVVYAVKSGARFDDVPRSTADVEPEDTVGFAFWLGVGAALLMAVDSVVAVILSNAATVSPV